MPNATHVRLAAAGKRLINSHGRNVELVEYQQSGDEFAPVLTETKTQLRAVAVSLTGKEDPDLQAKTMIVFLISTSKKPEQSMRLLDSGTTDGGAAGFAYSIKDIQMIAPGEIAVLYRLYCGV